MEEKASSWSQPVQPMIYPLCQSTCNWKTMPEYNLELEESTFWWWQLHLLRCLHTATHQCESPITKHCYNGTGAVLSPTAHELNFEYLDESLGQVAECQWSVWLVLPLMDGALRMPLDSQNIWKWWRVSMACVSHWSFMADRCHCLWISWAIGPWTPENECN